MSIANGTIGKFLQAKNSIEASTRNWKKLREKVREQIMSRPPDERFVMGAQNVRRCNRSIEGVAPGGFTQGGTKGPSNFRICSGSDARFISMAGRKTRHPQRKPRAQFPPSREGENIQSGGNKVGVRSGGQKSTNTRAARRFGGMRSDAR